MSAEIMSIRTCALLFAVAAVNITIVHGYQDTGTIKSRPWPPLRPPVNAGTIRGYLAPCEIVLSGNVAGAITIYQALLARLDPNCDADSNRTSINQLLISVSDPSSAAPSIDTDESFTLSIVIDRQQAQLVAETFAGALRGLETFIQMITISRESSALAFYIENCPIQIRERPSFPHRGILLDPARTFIPVDVIKQTIDGLLYSKMNVLHLHLSDSQSIPFTFPSLPELSEAAAYSSAETYSSADVKEIVDYARTRGIRIVPEFDTPGHARAWGLANPEITTCDSIAGPEYPTYCAEPPCGQLNPASQATFEVLQSAFSDVFSSFPDQSIHLGYDEVNTECWMSDPKTKQYMDSRGMSAADLLEEFYVKERDLIDGISNSSKNVTFWEEVIQHGLPLTSRDSVQLWSNKKLLQKTLHETNANVIVSWAAEYYLDCGRGNIFGRNSWCDPFKTALSMFLADPLDGLLNDDMHRVLGGESCLWGELVGTDLSVVAWPRAAAYGGRLWHYESSINSSEATLALEAHRQRLQSRDVPAAMVTSRFCGIDPSLCFGASSSTPQPQSDSDDLAFEYLVVGLSLLTCGVIAAVLAVIVIARKHSNQKHYMSLDPSATRLNRRTETPSGILPAGSIDTRSARRSSRSGGNGEVVWYGGVRADDGNAPPAKLFG